MRIFRRILKILIVLAVVCAAAVLGINSHVKRAALGKIISIEDVDLIANEDIDCILVLGAGVWNGNEPSPMLRDRLIVGTKLYELGASGKILMSGDHGTKGYDEVNVMKKYAVQAGVPSENVFMDHAGFSTYDSIYRAKEVFQAKKVIIVTQGYHLYRALYIADALGLEAYGVSATLENYMGQSAREMREILARNKDFFLSHFKVLPRFLGDPIPLTGDGNVTNDEYTDYID